MNEELQLLLRDYITDTLTFHQQNHVGSLYECEMTGCRLAVDLMNGHVQPETYRAIIEGNNDVKNRASGTG